MPMDMEASIPFVDAPECESLQWHDNVDGYRQFSGPANLARKMVISNELGAISGRAYSLTIPELLFAMNRAVSGGVNQWSHAYLSPDNLNLPQACIEDNLLAPADARFQALVVLGSQNVTQNSLAQLKAFADAGLPVIVAA
ncbi:hypothetical protein CSHISOI_01436 [Colletotrichum shisoi]|uniref:Uncharacterized protein n=1 Tax=Colletotrichum shisoi TaxID=2078593 RepID=A0A5Q4C4R2_9PEZI|nr:hypothetical protein CSHISOI_01436 [Colletotrichum shisoi]